MKIEWLGHSCFKLTESTGISLVTDPFDANEMGITMPEVSADIVTISHDHYDHNALNAVKDYKTVIRTTGDHGVEGVEIFGFKSCEELSPMLAELIGSIHILLIPVGGRYTIDAREAKDYVDRLMPDVVIPMHYMMDGYKTQFDELDEFLDLFPKEDIEYADTQALEFDRADFDGERTRVIVMKKIG